MASESRTAVFRGASGRLGCVGTATEFTAGDRQEPRPSRTSQDRTVDYRLLRYSTHGACAIPRHGGLLARGKGTGLTSERST